MDEFIGLLLLALFVGGGYLRRKLAEAAKRQQPAPPARPAVPSTHPTHAPLPAASPAPKSLGKQEDGYEGTNAPGRWRISIDNGLHELEVSADITSGSAPNVPWHGSIDIGASPEPWKLAQPRFGVDDAPSVALSGENSRQTAVPAVIPRFSREVAAQAVILGEILSRPRGARPGRTSRLAR